jgi:hypothetical protein
MNPRSAVTCDRPHQDQNNQHHHQRIRHRWMGLHHRPRTGVQVAPVGHWPGDLRLGVRVGVHNPPGQERHPRFWGVAEMTEFERRHEISESGWPRWYLIGPEGAVQLVAMPLPLPADMIEGYSLGVMVDGVRLTGVDIGYHSPVPRRVAQEPMSQCPLYGDGECYYGGTSLGADELLKMWAEAGCNDEIIWTSLEARYIEAFRRRESEDG